MVEPLVPLPVVEKLSSRVIRVLGGNPGKFTLQGTNTYIVGQGPSRLLIDTGEGKPEWIESLKSVLRDHKIAVDKAILTHWHPDHIGGVPDLLHLASGTKVYKHDPNEGWLNISHGQKFETDGATLKAFHCPGHTTDHMALILEEEDAMFTGDNILGQGTAVFEDYSTYMKSLDGMSKQFKGRAYPGHGPVIEDGQAKVLEYIKHRKEREKQVLDVLSQERDGGWTAMDIVKIIYKDYPKNLYAPAEKGILQILEKLLKEGKVTYDEDKDTWAIGPKSAL
ncbi:Metallo-hydrolase/oxidoreductase [Lindgomyces ingoldianus]|uniref:Metallo-hydrolase/oxidoreductase n=1 Tax=Lindgomyces ingoldianus TaxID=673940 RepID=A0ACB6QI25_9PLEO|nr:Metallo-hydrolase/oxidoreductase [Lindgomyces ingoldianus]KAF2466679.1 Metallo-hydrolase/oxidoreductase [Lindgomyces ingoldianus]